MRAARGALALSLGLGAAYAQGAPAAASPADTAWMLVATAMVVFMVPGLALFYGGMTRSHNILGTMMHSFIALGVVALQWVVVGYSLAFTDGTPWLGGLDAAFLRGIGPDSLQGTIPRFVFIAFQAAFACITPALIAGAIAERVKFKSYVLFILLWSTLVYDPVCHWMWQPNGFLYRWGAIDFAGGIVVHLISGLAGLAACLLIGKRHGLERGILPHNMVFVLLGTGMLWFGWFGFNAGSAVAANGLAALAFLNTFLAPTAGMCAWLLAERAHLGKGSALGAASGAVAGLAAVTPAAGSVMPQWGMVIAAVTSLVCYYFVSRKGKFGYDDSLDAFGVHGISGFVGTLGCGIFASYGFNSLFFHGAPGARPGLDQFLVQVKAIAITGAYSFLVTSALVWLISKSMGFRVTREEELQGLDLSVHGERAYNG